MAGRKDANKSALEKDREMVRIFLTEQCSQREAYSRSRGHKKVTVTDTVCAPRRFAKEETKAYLEELKEKIDRKVVEKISTKRAWNLDIAAEHFFYIIETLKQDIKDKEVAYDAYFADLEREREEQEKVLALEKEQLAKDIAAKVKAKQLTAKEGEVQFARAYLKLANKKKIDFKNYKAKVRMDLVKQKGLQEAGTELNNIFGVRKPDEMIFAPKVIFKGEEKFGEIGK